MSVLKITYNDFLEGMDGNVEAHYRKTLIPDYHPLRSKRTNRTADEPPRPPALLSKPKAGLDGRTGGHLCIVHLQNDFDVLHGDLDALDERMARV